MRDKMIRKLDDLIDFSKAFRVSIKFKDKWVKISEVDYVSLNDDDLLEFYNKSVAACSQPRG